MKRIFLACVALCCSLPSAARLDLEYHAAPPQDNKIPEEYKKKRSALQHRIWSAEGLALADERAIEREQQRAAAEQERKRRQAPLYGQRNCRKAYSKDARRQAACFTADLQR
ncbi:hypothetical protein V2T44_15085 [Serratia ficaria]|uniref:hypothetical protein n=1 Tax=Serratia ficaria TaxID=61651 RepID=UPI002ED4069E|nr:hypothetical protein [Serratia ficaria]